MLPKNELRKIYKTKRDAINKEERAVMDGRILAGVKGLGAYAGADAVYSYVNFGSEADTGGLIRDALESGRKVAVPTVTGKRRMEFNYIGEGNGVAIPHKGSVFIVPGLVFSETMYRIGYGGGFYDTYLAEHADTVKIGLCYGFQIAGGLIGDKHDVKMDYIVTEERVYV
jgi:5-formyltetrahydrofolate cyclo-ligase